MVPLWNPCCYVDASNSSFLCFDTPSLSLSFWLLLFHFWTFNRFIFYKQLCCPVPEHAFKKNKKKQTFPFLLSQFYQWIHPIFIFYSCNIEQSNYNFRSKWQWSEKELSLLLYNFLSFFFRPTKGPHCGLLIVTMPDRYTLLKGRLHLKSYQNVYIRP